MRKFRVYFNDGNRKLFNAPHIGAILNYIEQSCKYSYGVGDIVKIEEVANERNDSNCN